SNAYPWYRAAERAGAVVKTAPVDRIGDAIGASTRVVAVSWVQYSTGASVDLRALADTLHARGGAGADRWLVVDAIQGIGIAPFALAALGVDVVCGGTHKWLLGPLGHGLMACAPGRQATMTPVLHRAMTYGTPHDVDAEGRELEGRD